MLNDFSYLNQFKLYELSIRYQHMLIEYNKIHGYEIESSFRLINSLPNQFIDC